MRSDAEVHHREEVMHAMASRLERIEDFHGPSKDAFRALVAGECLLGLDEHQLVVIKDQPDHYATFDKMGWFVEHSVACRIAGTIGTCAYNGARAIVGVEYGRWRITGLYETGLPILERS